VTPLPELLHVLLNAGRGGCERNTLNLVRYLPSVLHRILLLAEEGPMCIDWRAAGATVDVLPQAEWRTNRMMIAALRARAAEHPPAAVMIWHGLVFLPQFIHAYNPLGVPVAVHGGNPAHLMSRWVDWKFALLGLRYSPRGPLPTYICCSKHVADSFDSSWYLRRFPRVVVPNGVEVPPGPPHEPRPFDPGRPFVIGMLARLSQIKDHTTLIRAFAVLRKQYPNAVLELPGAGEEEHRLRRLAAGLGVADAVRFLGDVADVYGLMRGWDLFAYATTEEEGLGNAVAEAMMLGLPAVVTDVGPMRDFAGDGTAVALTPAADPAALAATVARLIPDRGERVALAARGRAWAMATFGPTIYAKGYEKALFPEGTGRAFAGSTQTVV
jgi:glycosyltransferase involved in cell wall biosynthesis